MDALPTTFPIQQDQGFLAVVLEGIANAVVITDAQGVIQWVNTAYTELSGYRADEAIGSTPRFHRPDLHDGSFDADMWSTILGGGAWRGEVTSRRKDGSLYTVTETIAPMLGTDSRPSHFVAVCEDVTRLHTSAARLRALFEHSLDAIVLFDDDTRYVDSNPALRAMLGYRRDELVGMSLVELVAPSDVPRIAAGWSQFKEDGQQRGTYALRRKDGSDVEVEYQSVGNVLPGVHLAIARDITEQRKAEADLRFDRQLLEAIGEAVIATDLDGKVRYWNAAAELLYGWSQQEVFGRSLTEFNVIPEMAAQAEAIVAAVEAGETWTGEFAVRRKDGSMFPALVTDSPYWNTSGDLAGIIGVSTDLSDLKATQALIARRGDQQTALAALGRLALGTGDVAAVHRYAERMIPRALGATSWHAEIIDADGTPSGDDPFSVDIGASGRILVWDGNENTLLPKDTEFLDAVADVLDAAFQRDAARAQIEHLATHDQLTGLGNRTLLYDRLDHVKGIARRTKQRYTLLFLDLDDFKYVNDAWSHETGDELLRAVSVRLTGAVRPSDTVARLGGDEFVIVCPDANDVRAATAVAARVIDALRSPFDVHGSEIVMSTSVGIVIGDDTSDTAVLLRNADAAMYRAKDNGRNRFEFFDHDMQQRARQRLDLITGLRQALDHNGIETHYQPIINLATGATVGVEALARWRLPSGELIPPDQFIPLAEDAGLIERLGEQVLERACSDMLAHVQASHDHFRVAVNVSPRQLAHPSLVDTVTRVLRATGMPPASLHLEVTESALLSITAVEDTMHALRDLGIKFAIDDFGTGYSSLANLRRLPVDTLKIDRSFVSGVTTDLQDRALVSATIELARSFGLTTIAEGVETEQQATRLRSLGADLAQGYLWSKSLDINAMSAFLRRG